MNIISTCGIRNNQNNRKKVAPIFPCGIIVIPSSEFSGFSEDERLPEDAGSGEGRGKSPAEPLFFSTRLTPIPMADVIPQLQEDQSRPHHRVRVKQGVLSGLEGTLIEQLDGDRILIAYGADADAANSRARGAYIAIGAAAVELLSG